MIVWIAAFVVAAPLTLLLHESSHALMAKSQGSTILSFRPWPSKQRGKWWLGYVRWTNPPFERRTRWLYGSPLLISAPMAIALGLVSIWWPPLLAWAIWEAIDFVNWWKGYFKITIPFVQRWAQPVERLDGYKFRYFSK
jgi:hypothetical protein